MKTLKEALTNVLSSLNIAEKKEILNVLYHILQKIIENPSRAKFRSLKKDNKTFVNKLLQFKESDELLRSLGFEEETEIWFFPVKNDHKLSSNLTEIRAFIKEHVNTIYNNQDSIFETGTASSSAHLPTDEKNVTENTSNLGDTCNNSEGLTLGGLSKRRLEKERLELLSQKENTIKLLQEHADKWIIQITGAENTLYSNETFQMQFKFTEKYPIESPEVIFLGQPPIHPHIYSNGHICLSILYDHWSPVLSVNSICLSIISMLSSCKKKRKPLDDILYCSTGPRISPKNMKWMFHDDKV
ncbi:ubiquitin-conjugating enzyme E2 [Plasmodium falciparum NF54]|uniref:Ubiquitin-conjugating enzyme E2, putative n=3 Tax=Plasmodium (Laverania) TaxID=418107 RepID=Q8ILW5_PLAF7|nr:ubiquitin-conjugating enzyme E2, putative [Plasmodium falciparum 3D7]KAF4329459.1 ubiquitin-conjugating enzyme E2 [Plasmodium falciparum NF54]PKC49500.1 ubiquitin-conjugating enzyme E2 [Plasmodium falciparum NF54]CZT99840.1 ubiquitin-conjugating enzyme E2, putative [Plasmodium falciparum 3D7]|eukprot:XP_001348301.1 ubiquitin-conjugating enzyme, putative [Plasmodium falciparum 3D7]